MKSSDTFQEVLERSVITGLQNVLGDTAKTLCVYLDPSIAVRRPDSYTRCLHKCFPVEDMIETLVKSISQQLYGYLAIQFQERTGWKLSDYIRDARERSKISQ